MKRYETRKIVVRQHPRFFRHHVGTKPPRNWLKTLRARYWAYVETNIAEYLPGFDAEPETPPHLNPKAHWALPHNEIAGYLHSNTELTPKREQEAQELHDHALRYALLAVRTEHKEEHNARE